jgi:hypothetical protein
MFSPCFSLPAALPRLSASSSAGSSACFSRRSAKSTPGSCAESSIRQQRRSQPRQQRRRTRRSPVKALQIPQLRQSIRLSHPSRQWFPLTHRTPQTLQIHRTRLIRLIRPALATAAVVNQTGRMAVVNQTAAMAMAMVTKETTNEVHAHVSGYDAGVVGYGPPAPRLQTRRLQQAFPPW